MSEKTKEEQLKEKLVEFFDKKLSDLNTKFTSDIEKIESYKYEYFDTIIKIYRDIQEEQKKQEEHEKQEKEKEKEKPEKKVEEPKHEKVTRKKPANNNKERPKTPLGTNKPKVKGDKDKEKQHDNTTHDTKEKKKPTITTSGVGNSKPSKPGRLNTETGKRPVTGKSDAKSKTTIGKKPGVNNKKTEIKKTKGKKEAKSAKEESKEQKEEPKEETPKVEEKKPIIINPKYIINIPEELKNKNNLCSVYFILKKNYLDKKNILLLASSNPLLYKCLGNNMKFLLDDKKKEVDKNAKEIESFLNNYGDLKTYLTKEFSLSKKAMNSLSMFKKEEIPKNDNLPNELGNILKYLYYLLDEKFDEKMSIKELLDNMFNNIVEKIEDKSFKSLLVNYFQKNKFLNLTQEKADNINKIVNENNTILNMAAIGKTCRPFNFISFLLKEVHDYINQKTSDGHYYYELKQKNQQLQKYLDFIYLYDNNGKERNKPKEEKPEEQAKVEENKNETEEKVEKKEEENKTEEKPAEEKKEEIKPEVNKVEEESVKKEENTEP